MATTGQAWFDHIAEHRDRGLRDNVAIAARCNGIVLVGGRISTGMRRELDAVHPIDAGREWWRP